MSQISNGRYEGIYNGFSLFGEYSIAVYAAETGGDVSVAKTLTFYQNTGPDIFENDDNSGTPTLIDVNAELPQHHNFHQTGDADWLIFAGVQGNVYTIRIQEQETLCNAIVEIYNSNLTLSGKAETSAGSTSLTWDWTCPSTDLFYMKIRNASPENFGTGTGYRLEIYRPVGPFTGFIKGMVSDAAGYPISRAMVTTDAQSSALTRPDGRYIIIQEPGIVNIFASANGYQVQSAASIPVSEAGTTIQDFALTPNLPADTDGDGTPDPQDGCPVDPTKIAPGQCGCGIAETDADGDGIPDCIDLCPADAAKTQPGPCGCGQTETDADQDGTPDCKDACPTDPLKIQPGVCGCGKPDTDSDANGVADCLDDLNKDSDGDGIKDGDDGCPFDSSKANPGTCGCGVSDADTDGDGIANCKDNCPEDPAKTEPGNCGCGIADVDADGDGTPNCKDFCPNDPLKIAPGLCGCGTADKDTDSDGMPDCSDSNTSPFSPVLISPENNARINSTQPTLQTHLFSDLDAGDTHGETVWQISQSADFSLLTMEIVTRKYLTTFTVPELILTYRTSYFWRVKFKDNRGVESAWSQIFSFQHPDTDPEDQNSNGLPDSQEPTSPTDVDENGTLDQNQTDIRVIQTASGHALLGLQALQNVKSIEVLKSGMLDDLSGSENQPEGALLGSIQFRILLNEDGNSAKILIHLSRSLPSDIKWFVFHPALGWMDVSDQITISSARKNVEIEIQDGGTNDADGVRNRAIVYIAAPANRIASSESFPVLQPSDDVGGVGCFIDMLKKY
jgi:hypothetical protein